MAGKTGLHAAPGLAGGGVPLDPGQENSAEPRPKCPNPNVGSPGTVEPLGPQTPGGSVAL